MAEQPPGAEPETTGPAPTIEDLPESRLIATAFLARGAAPDAER